MAQLNIPPRISVVFSQNCWSTWRLVCFASADDEVKLTHLHDAALDAFQQVLILRPRHPGHASYAAFKKRSIHYSIEVFGSPKLPKSLSVSFVLGEPSIQTFVRVRVRVCCCGMIFLSSTIMWQGPWTRFLLSATLKRWRLSRRAGADPGSADERLSVRRRAAVRGGAEGRASRERLRQQRHRHLRESQVSPVRQ